MLLYPYILQCVFFLLNTFKYKLTKRSGPQYLCMIRYWLKQLWRLRSPMICACKLETQLSQWYSSKVWQPESQWCRFYSKSDSENQDHQWQEKIDVPAPQSDREQPSSTCLFYSGPQLRGRCRLTPGRAIYVTHATNLKANLFWKHPHTHTWKWL